MPGILPNGLGLTTGLDFATARPLYPSGLVLYVHHTGNASNNALDRAHPVPTFQAAMTLAAATPGTFICFLDGHTEELSSNVTVNQRVILVGEGLSEGRPTVEFILPAGSTNGWTFASPSDGSWIENIRFMPPGSAETPGASSGAQVSVGSRDNVVFNGCDFYVDQYIQGTGLLLQAAANSNRFKNCKFLSIEESTDPDERPARAMQVSGDVTRLILDGCTFDGGISGYTGVAFDASAAIVTDLTALNLSLLRGSDFQVAATSTVSISPRTVTGSSRVIIP